MNCDTTLWVLTSLKGTTVNNFLLMCMALLIVCGIFAGHVFTPISMIVFTLSIGMAVIWFMLLVLFMKKRLYFVETSLLTCSFIIPMWIWDFFSKARYDDIPAILEWVFKS